MIKPYAVLCISLALLFLMGCQSAEPDEEVPSLYLKSDVSSMVGIQIYLKQDIIRIFNEDNGHSSYFPTDCAVAKDSAYGLIGIVQYTDDEGNPCNLAFMDQEGWSHPVGLAASGGFAISNDSVLRYLGNGKVELSLLEKETGKVFDYTVAYSTADSNTHYEVSSTERKTENV